MVGGRPTLQLGLPCLALVASLASLVVAVVALVATSTSTPREEGLPLGSVVGWVPPLPTSAPPRGWLVANGSLIPRGPWGGQRTPNLGGRVLVGGGGALGDLATLPLLPSRVVSRMEELVGEKEEGVCLHRWAAVVVVQVKVQEQVLVVLV